MNFLRKLRNPKGFTLVELIIVIMIIGILAATMLPKVLGGPARARDAQRKSNLLAISTALDLYYADNGETYPATNVGFTAAISPYMANVPTEDPLNEGAYQYIYCVGPVNSVPNQDFALSVLLETGPAAVATRFHEIGTNLGLTAVPKNNTKAGTCGAGVGGVIDAAAV